MKCTLDSITNIVILSLTVYKAVTRVSFLVRQWVWGPSRSPAGPGQSHVKGFRGKALMKFCLYLKLQGYFGYENDCTHVILIKVVFMALNRRSILQLAYSMAIPEPEESAENKY